MGKLRDWLDRQQTAAAERTDEILRDAANKIAASEARREEGERELYEVADASRKSMGGSVPDEIVDEQLRSYEAAKRHYGL